MMAAVKALCSVARNNLHQAARDLRSSSLSVSSTFRLVSIMFGNQRRQLTTVSVAQHRLHHQQQQPRSCHHDALEAVKHQRPAAFHRQSVQTARSLSADYSLQSSQVASVDVGGSDSRTLVVRWTDGDDGHYPFSWLRDHCRCQTCFDAVTGLRRLAFPELNLDAAVVSAQTSQTPNELTVSWSDGHRGIVPLDWLRRHAFYPSSSSSSTTTTTSAAASAASRPPESSRVQLWRGSEFLPRIPHFRFDEVMKDDRALCRWIATLEEQGLLMMDAAPTETGILDILSSRVAYNRMTVYGTISCVQSKPNPTSVAYDTNELVLHNDLSYYQQVPCVQLMHCICQAAGEGGDTLLADGFEAANQLRAMYPDYFHILANTTLDYYFRCYDFFDFYQMSRHRTIELDDETGEVVRINYSTHARDSFLRLNVDDVDPFYKALQAFTERLYHPDNIIVHKLQPGEIVCFDNWRVLHGRKKFFAESGTGRTLEHCYIEWDVMRGRRRHLEQRHAANHDTSES